MTKCKPWLMLISRDFAFSYQTSYQIRKLDPETRKLFGNTYRKLIEINDYIIIKPEFSPFIQFIFIDSY